MSRLYPSTRTLLAVSALLPMIGCGGPAPSDPDLIEQRDEVFARYFTEEAIEVLARVPIRTGSVNGQIAFSVGDDFGSQLAALAFGNLPIRQVLVGEEGVSDFILFHEYLHQADYSGLIERASFLDAYEQLEQDSEFSHLAPIYGSRRRASCSDDFLCLLVLSYGNGVTRELIADLIGDWVDGIIDLPDYLLDVYRRALLIDELGAASVFDGHSWPNSQSQTLPVRDD